VARTHPWVCSFLGALVSFGMTGCFSYTARLGPEVRRGDVRVLPVEARTRATRLAPPSRFDTTVWVKVTGVPANVRLREATLASAGAAPCSGPVAARLGREEGRGATAPLVAGETLAFEFALADLGAFAAHPSLDLLVETPLGAQRCVSVPLSDDRANVAWEPRRRFTVGLDLSLEGLTAEVGSVDRLVTVPISVGVWLGKYQVHVGAGIAGVGCPEPHCATTADSKINYATSVPVIAGVRRILYESGELSLGVGLRYRAMRLVADTFEGRTATWMHGPILAPYIGAGTPVRTDGSDLGGAREALVAFELPVGYGVTTDGEHTVSIGVNLSMLLSVL
jgi:hypothetical protein